MGLAILPLCVHLHSEMFKAVPPDFVVHLRLGARSLCYFIHTLFLFTYSDIKTILIPTVSAAQM